MPISKKMNNLLQASKAACHTAAWHIVLAISAGGNHVTEEPAGYATQYTLAYASLPCSPYSA